MARVRTPIPKELLKAARSRVAERRPACPSCGMRCPAPDEPRDYWFEPHGHRRPQDGEPCPGFKKEAPLAPPPPLPVFTPRAAAPAARSAIGDALDLLALWEQAFAALTVEPKPKQRRPRKPKTNVEVSTPRESRVPPQLMLSACQPELATYFTSEQRPKIGTVDDSGTQETDTRIAVFANQLTVNEAQR